MARSADKPQKEGLSARLRRQWRETRALGHTLRHEPRAFPGAAGALLKRWLRAMWQARGGGFYASGFVVTFVILELRSLVDEVLTADGVVAFFTEQFVEFLVRFLSDSLTNTVYAFIWPVWVLERFGGAGFALLAGGYLVFAYGLKAPLTRWLFGETVAAPPEGG